MSQPEILSYATPATAKPPSIWLYRVSFWGVVGSGTVGVLILLLYLFTGEERVAIGGLYWLMIGGGITAVAFVLALIYAAIGRARRFPPPSSSRKAAGLVSLPIANCVVAMGCFFGGIWLMGYHARSVIIRNNGTTPIDHFELSAPSFSYTSSRLDPGESVTVHFPSHPEQTMKMRVHIGSRIIPYTVMESMHADPIHGGKRYIHLDGETGYKNRQGSEPF